MPTEACPTCWGTGGHIDPCALCGGAGTILVSAPTTPVVVETPVVSTTPTNTHLICARCGDVGDCWVCGGH